MKKKPSFLKSKKLIDLIFKNGHHFWEYPLLVKFLQLNETKDISFVIGVKKKYIPKAVDRNKIKRLMRNSVRQCFEELKDKIPERKKNYHIEKVEKSGNSAEHI